MTLDEVAKRLSILESEMAHLKAAQEGRRKQNAREWFEQFSGSMANDPGFDEVLRLGKEWRDSQREDYDVRPESGAA